MRNRFQPATVTAGTIIGLRTIRSGTVRNRLREQGLRARRPAVRPALQPHRRVAWLNCLGHTHNLRFRNDQRVKVVLTDVCRINRLRADGRQKVYLEHRECQRQSSDRPHYLNTVRIKTVSIKLLFMWNICYIYLHAWWELPWDSGFVEFPWRPSSANSFPLLMLHKRSRFNCLHIYPFPGAHSLTDCSTQRYNNSLGFWLVKNM